MSRLFSAARKRVRRVLDDAKPIGIELRFLLHKDGTVYQEWEGRPGIEKVTDKALVGAVHREFEIQLRLAREAMG